MDRMEKKPYKTKVERDIQISEDIKVSGIQGGKVIGNNLALFSFIIGIPLLILGAISLINIIFDLGFPRNSAVIILVLLVTAIGSLLTIGGYFLSKV